MNEITVTPSAQPLAFTELPVAELRRRKQLLHDVMKDVMVPGQHYGVIPGTDGKPALLKSGAEMLCMTFRLSSQFAVVLRELPNNHREYRVDCTLTAPDGSVVATGVGSASTMESKHRWRLQNRKCPICGAEAIRKGRNGFFCGAKVGGCGENFPATDKRIIAQPLGKVENPDVADQWNTVLKMAAKRAHTHATLLATAASDMFVPEDEDGDGAEERQEDPPPPPPAEKRDLSDKEKLVQVCLKAVKALDWTREEVSELLLANDITPPQKSWGQLSEEALLKVKGLLEEELRKGMEVKQ